MSDVSLSAQGFVSLASHNDLGVTLPAAAAGRMRSPENRPAPGEHLHVMPIMRGHMWHYGISHFGKEILCLLVP